MGRADHERRRVIFEITRQVLSLPYVNHKLSLCVFSSHSRCLHVFCPSSSTSRSVRPVSLNLVFFSLIFLLLCFPLLLPFFFLSQGDARLSQRGWFLDTDHAQSLTRTVLSELLSDWHQVCVLLCRVLAVSCAVCWPCAVVCALVCGAVVFCAALRCIRLMQFVVCCVLCAVLSCVVLWCGVVRYAVLCCAVLCSVQSFSSC